MYKRKTEWLYKGILDWTTHEERLEIAREEGVTSRQGINNIISGRSKNFRLLNRLTERAERNKNLVPRSKQLENIS